MGNSTQENRLFFIAQEHIALKYDFHFTGYIKGYEWAMLPELCEDNMSTILGIPKKHSWEAESPWGASKAMGKVGRYAYFKAGSGLCAGYLRINNPLKQEVHQTSKAKSKLSGEIPPRSEGSILSLKHTPVILEFGR